jgi:hypothetical protein
MSLLFVETKEISNDIVGDSVECEAPDADCQNWAELLALPFLASTCVSDLILDAHRQSNLKPTFDHLHARSLKHCVQLGSIAYTPVMHI